MATVRLEIRESRTTTVEFEFEVDEALLADPGEHRLDSNGNRAGSWALT